MITIFASSAAWPVGPSEITFATLFVGSLAWFAKYFLLPMRNAEIASREDNTKNLKAIADNTTAINASLTSLNACQAETNRRLEEVEKGQTHILHAIDMKRVHEGGSSE